MGFPAVLALEAFPEARRTGIQGKVRGDNGSTSIASGCVLITGCDVIHADASVTSECCSGRQDSQTLLEGTPVGGNGDASVSAQTKKKKKKKKSIGEIWRPHRNLEKCGSSRRAGGGAALPWRRRRTALMYGRPRENKRRVTLCVPSSLARTRPLPAPVRWPVWTG